MSWIRVGPDRFWQNTLCYNGQDKGFYNVLAIYLADMPDLADPDPEWSDPESRWSVFYHSIFYHPFLDMTFSDPVLADPERSRQTRAGTGPDAGASGHIT